jgi:hypothetical protein
LDALADASLDVSETVLGGLLSVGVSVLLSLHADSERAKVMMAVLNNVRDNMVI